MEKMEGSTKFFMRVDKIGGALGSSGVHLLPVECGDPERTEVPTSGYKYEQRAILYRDDITGAKA